MLETDGDPHPWMVTVVSESVASEILPEVVCSVSSAGETEATVPNTPEASPPPENMTGRIADSVSPVIEVATTSIINGLEVVSRSKLTMKLPSWSGRTSRPFTLMVASGEVTPLTDTWSNSVTRLTSGECRRSIKAWL